MNFLRLLPVILSLLLLSAHFSRQNLEPLILVPLISVGLLLVPQPWVARLTQVVLVLAALEWLRTAVILILQRQSLDMPWVRLAVILGVVALFTLVSATAFRSAGLRDRYRLR